jgi:hypothetical protein
MIVRENIHHEGAEDTVRVQEIEPTWAGFVQLLLSSPYPGERTADSLANNPAAALAFAGLVTRSRHYGDSIRVHGNQIGIDFGWAHYEVLKP